ncbi:MAG: hypothetical protein QW315_00290 [Candidatus Hadarchaeum sp.]
MTPRGIASVVIIAAVVIVALVASRLFFIIQNPFPPTPTSDIELLAQVHPRS